MLFIPVQVIIRHVIRKKKTLCEDILNVVFLSVAAFFFALYCMCINIKETFCFHSYFLIWQFSLKKNCQFKKGNILDLHSDV